MLVIKRPAGQTIKASGRTYIKTGIKTFFDEAYGHTNGPAYSSPSANTIHNGIYASNGNHPTDMVVAMTGNVPVYMDQVTLVGSSASVTAKVPENTVKRPHTATDGEGHVFGYGTCMWLRKCDQAGEIMGSSCSATLSNVVYSGYCFTSDVGSLECGFLSASDDEYGDKPISFDVSVSPNTLPSLAGVVNVEGAAPATTFVASTPGTPGTVHRCPTGSPAKSLGSFVSKRTLSAGCMISTDGNYDSLAEVHVPDYCTAPADYKKGCMLPAALNFDPTAKQIGSCKFPTKGCSSPTALNYNSLATMLPDVGKECIEPIVGCTVMSTPYVNVDYATPGFRSGFYGSAQTGSGGWKYRKQAEGDVTTTAGANLLPTHFTGSAVVSTTPGANVNSGCVVSVEGCMDSTARNYDPLATVNANTWCVPDISGCMTPSPAYASDSYANPETESYMFRAKPNGPTAHYSSTVTRHVPSMCRAARYGCTHRDAINYDPLATVNASCFFYVYGCLNPMAVNFGCRDTTYDTPCRGATLPATGTSGGDRTEVTTHYTFTCKWTNEAPSPSPPPPPAPPTSSHQAQHFVKTDLNVAGSYQDFLTRSDELLTWYKGAFGVADTTPLTLEITDATARRRLEDQKAGRRSLTGAATALLFSANVEDAAAASALSSTLAAHLGDSPTSATAAMASLGVTVLTAPVHTTEVQYVEVPAVEASYAGLIGGVVGGASGALVTVCLACYFYRRSRAAKPIYAA